jgi:uncharacterized protein YcaQ
MRITIDDLRRFAVARSLFEPTSLKRALNRMGFVQADPIRAPARAQDLTLRHRVKDYRAGDLERKYSKLGLEEDFFVVYGFVSRRIEALMHPRSDAEVPAEGSTPWSAAQKERAQSVLDFVRERGTVHPRDVDEHFSHGKVRNYWGGTSNASTHLLAAMHYRGMLRVARRQSGVRLYAAHQHGPEPADVADRRERLDALVDAAVQVYAPLPSASLSYLVRRLRYAVPQWRGELTMALKRARQRLAHSRVEGVDWYWPANERATGIEVRGAVRLLTPFDPVVWDRDRLELLWNWTYRFEAYTPASKRKLGYYALPLLWRDRVIGWANLSVISGELESELGYIDSRAPRDRGFRRELNSELDRMREFLSLGARRVARRNVRTKPNDGSPVE